MATASWAEYRRTVRRPERTILVVEAAARRWLLDVGADRIDHPGGTLLGHLLRTAAILREWGADDWLIDTGLLHAAYGTAGFDEPLLGIGQRPTLAALASEPVEEAVYLYCSCDRGCTYPRLEGGSTTFRDRFERVDVELSGERLAGFMELTAANELDVLGHHPQLRERYGSQMTDWLLKCRRHLSDPAIEAVTRFRSEHLRSPG